MLDDSVDNFNHAGLPALRTAPGVARVMLQGGGHQITTGSLRPPVIAGIPYNLDSASTPLL